MPTPPLPCPAPSNPGEPLPRVDESALLHARVLESMAEGVSATDENGVLIYSSRAHDAMFGYAPGELLGRHASILNAYPPEENARFTRDVLTQLREKGEWVGEISNVRKDGTPFTTRARMTGLNLGGKRHWVCVQEDLTSHKLLDAERLRARQQAQSLTETLRESEARYRLLVEHASDGIFLTDLEGRCVDVNSSGCRMLGHTREELLGLGLANVLVPEDRPRFAQLRADLRAAPDTIQVAEWTLRCGDGRLLPVEISTRLLPDGRWQGMVRDISERKRAEEAQRQNEERWRFLAQAGERLLASLDVGQTFATLAQLVSGHLQENCLVESFDEDGALRIVALCYLDPEKEKLLRTIERDYGLQQARSVRMQAVQERHALVVEPTEERLRQLARDAEHLRLLRALGTTRIAIIPLVARGHSLGVLTVSSCRPGRDFTPAELGLLEELATRAAVAIDNARLYAASQAAIRARDAFLSIASHELNTPITSLKLQLQGLERGIERLPQAEAARAQVGPKFQVVQRQLRRLASLVTELLDLSRITAGRMKLEPEPVDVAALVREVAARAAEDLSRAGCALSLHLPEQLAGHFDRLRLDQVVTNLLSNAMKYGHGRPIELTLEPVGLRELGLEGDGGALRLRVKDHGIGIDPAHQARLFRRFERLESERHYSGFGLGLWIVKQILDAMGGHIGVRSALGEGACFEVLLPLTPPTRA